MNKVKKWFFEHRLAFFIFALLFLYEISFANGGQWFCVSRETYSYHAVDFSMGFCNKFLAGALYHAVVGVYTETAVTAYLSVIYAVWFILIAFLAEKFYKNIPQEHRKEAAILLFFALTGPFTIAPLTKTFGTLDFYWVLLFVIGVLCLKRRVLKYLLPVITFAILLTHFGAILNYVPALLLMMLFYAFISEKKGEKAEYIVVFTISLLVSLAAVAYFLLYEKGSIAYSLNEFKEIMKQRGAQPDYYNYALYSVAPKELEEFFLKYKNEALLQPGFSGAVARILLQLKIAFNVFFLESEFLKFKCIFALFTIGVLCVLLVKECKAQSQIKIKFLIVLAMLLGVSSGIGGMLFSNDFFRWLVNGIIILFTFIMLLSYELPAKSTLALIHKITQNIKPVFLIGFGCFYAAIVYSLY